ncbi:glycolipid transfer protein (GLTP) domain-containing protein [Ditylenchus destructor]|uniref:Glycolipid transfer protein (GLTP) domain-containing protein n=1 Tax=Ditylenchus destructor TaxID=166010 RepID=A0AAD4MZS8_9BILA|nr:glycolipid transfer protein (GLTP) domain-containing protein [Ditylenchus destructor]
MSAENEPVDTYFSNKDRMFPELEDGLIPTEQFLMACQGVADFVGFLGKAFSPVKSDISLLWLKRGLEFMLEMLRLLVKEYNGTPSEKQRSENMTKILNEAYEKSLKRHHNFVSKQLFKLVIHAAPYRKDLLKALAYGREGLEDVCVLHISELLGNFESNVNSLVEHYYVKNLETRPA